MIDLESIQQLPERQRLTELESQISETSLKLDDVLTSAAIPVEIAEAYGQAIGKLGKEAIALATGPTLQAAYNQLSEGTDESSGHLDYLKSILGEEAVRVYESGLDVREAEAESFFNKYGMFVDVFASVPEAAETVDDDVVDQEKTINSDETEETETKSPLKIRIGQGVVKFGRRGKSYKLVEVPVAKKGRDIASERTKALTVLGERNGEWIDATALKKEVQIHGTDSNYWTPIKNWLLKLSYSNQPVIQQTGHSRSSKYRFNPAFEAEFHILPDEPSKESQKRIIDRSDVFVAANHLIQFNPVLKSEFGFYIDKNLLKQLKLHAPDYSHIKGNTQEIYRAREEALNRIVGLFDDENLFMNFLSQVDEDSPEYQFVDMLFGLNEDEGSVLQRIMRSRLERDAIDARTVEFWVIENETNAVVLNAKVQLGDGQTKKIEEPDRPQNLGAGEVIHIQHPSTAEELSENIDSEPQTEDEAQPESKETEPQKSKAQLNYDAARVHVGQFIDALLAQKMSATEIYDIGQIRMFVPQNMRSHYTPTKLRRLIYGDNGSKGTPKPIDMEKLVTLYIETDSHMPVLSKKAKKTLLAEALARVRSMR